MNLALKEFPQLGQPIPAGFAAPAENVARVYAMVTNIDTNVGKVLKALEAKRTRRQHHRRLPHRQWPRQGAVQRRPARVERVGVRRRHPRSLLHPLARAFSGRRRGRPHRRPYRPGAHVARRLRRGRPRRAYASTARACFPCSKGIQTAGWPDRTLFFQWHRGDQPELGRAFAARSQRTSSCATSPRSAPPRCRRSSSTTWNATRSSCTTSPSSTPTSFPRCTPNTRRGSRTCHPPAASSPSGSRWEARARTPRS